MEIRTKSANIQTVENLQVTDNTTFAFTINPQEVIDMWEKKTPTALKRMEAAKTLIEKGWRVGLRIEPIILFDNWEKVYVQFFHELNSIVPLSGFYNIFYGIFKMPSAYFTKIQKMYPESSLYHSAYEKGKNGEISYSFEARKKIKDVFIKQLCQYGVETKSFSAF